VMREPVILDKLLDRALAQSDYYGRRSRFARENPLSPIKRGMGIAAFYHGSGFTGSGERYLNSLAGVDVTPDGKRVYVANVFGSCTPNCAPAGSVSVINTATNTVTDTIAVGGQPLAFGRFIPSGMTLPKFAGTPGKANCYGQSVSALTSQYHGINAAAAALGYSSAKALQNTIVAYCEA